MLPLCVLRATTGVPKVVGHLPAAVLHQLDPCGDHTPGLVAVLGGAVPSWCGCLLHVGEFLQGSSFGASQLLSRKPSTSGVLQKRPVLCTLHACNRSGGSLGHRGAALSLHTLDC